MRYVKVEALAIASPKDLMLQMSTKDESRALHVYQATFGGNLITPPTMKMGSDPILRRGI
jgi:hypothetical protein